MTYFDGAVFRRRPSYQWLALLLILPLFPWAAGADTYQAKTEISVLNRPGPRPAELLKLTPGQVFEVRDEKIKGGFRRVEVRGPKGQPVFGFVDWRRNEKKTRRLSDFRIGAGLGMNLWWQAPRTIKLTSSSGDQGLNATTGAAVAPAVFAEWLTSQRRAVRLEAQYMALTMSGHLAGEVVGEEGSPVEVRRELISFGGLYRWDLGASRTWWAGLGARTDIGVGVQVKVDDVVIAGSETSLPFFIFLQGAAGGEYRLTGRHRLFLQGRGGFAVNVSPPIFAFDLILGWAFRL